jgi:YfiH family protein
MPVETIMDPVRKSDEETLAESGFYWREKGDLKLLVCSALELAGFANGFSTRTGGVSPFPNDSLNLAGFDDDTAENISENRRRFLSLFPRDHRLATAWQIHGDDIRSVRTDDDIESSDLKFDALISELDATLLGVKTADCVPVLIGDPSSGVFAAVHAGWRGTSLSIAAKAVDAMHRDFGAHPPNMIAAIGPAACGKNYEIGREVIEAFGANIAGSERYFTDTREGHALVDLHLANADQLINAGVPRSSIYTAPFCTMERTDLFFSYRLEKKTMGRTGRLLSVIGRA